MKAAQREIRREEPEQLIQVLPLFGKDEMNLVEFPFGPITPSATKTLEVEHQAFDKTLRREVTRRLIITGSDAFGLPRPVDDQVLVGLKTLTHEAGYQSREVRFSRYQLCQVLGWQTDGRTYRRLEESFDRIAGTTLKFKDAWWDKGEQQWKSKTFHLIEEVNLCTRDEFERMRVRGELVDHKLCSFVWGEVIWKSFQDGFIKTLDMNLFRRIAKGRRHEVPLRLFRVLDKRFYHGRIARFDLDRLCIGTLGLSPNYSPSQMVRVLERACNWLATCSYFVGMKVEARRVGRSSEVLFIRAEAGRHKRGDTSRQRATPDMTFRTTREVPEEDRHRKWLSMQHEAELYAAEQMALESRFGSELEQRIVAEARARGEKVRESGRIRSGYVHRYLDATAREIAACERADRRVDRE